MQKGNDPNLWKKHFADFLKIRKLKELVIDSEEGEALTVKGFTVDKANSHKDVWDAGKTTGKQ